MDEFEQELRQALERRPAPPTLKRRVLAMRHQQELKAQRRMVWRWGFASAFATVALLIAVVVAVGANRERERRLAEERRQGEAARQQVLVALRITNHALQRMNTQLAEHNRSD